MKRHTNVTLVLAAFLAAASVVLAIPHHSTAGGYYPGYSSSAGYSDGYTNASGYTYQDGYWWYGDQAYRRVKYSEPYYYYSCGTRCTGYRSAYKYEPVYLQKEKVVVTKEDLANGSEDGWRGKLLEIAGNRDKWEAKARQSAQEHNEFLESVKFLGMQGNFHWNGYGYEMSYAQNPYAYEGYGQKEVFQQYGQFPAAQGQTVYGYNEIADIYANVDLGQLYDSVLRLREQSYGYESKATSETHALVGDLASKMAEIKEIEAKGRAASAALKASEAKDRTTLLREFWSAYPSASGTTSTTTRRSQSTSSVTVGGMAGGGGQALALVERVVANKCISCHTSGGAQGGLNLDDLTALTPEQSTKILDRIVSPDENARMPLAQDRSPGEPLSREEIAAFFFAIYGPAKP